MAGRGNSKVIRVKEPIANFVVPYKNGTQDRDAEVELTEDRILLFKFKGLKITFEFDDISTLVELAKEEL